MNDTNLVCELNINTGQTPLHLRHPETSQTRLRTATTSIKKSIIPVHFQNTYKMGKFIDTFLAMGFSFCLWTLPVMNVIFPYFYSYCNEDDMMKLQMFNVAASFVVLASYMWEREEREIVGCECLNDTCNGPRFPDQAAINRQFSREMGRK